MKTIEDLQQQTRAKDNLLHEKESTIAAKDEEIQHIQQQLMQQLNKIGELELQLAQKDDKVEVQEGQPLEVNQCMVTQLQKDLLQKETVVQNQQEKIKYFEQLLASGSEGATIQLKWKKGWRVPEMMNRGANAVIRRVGYFKLSGSPTVQACDFTTGQLSILPECPHYNFSLVVVNNFFTVVGGELLGEPTNVLLSLIGEGKDRKCCVQ